MGRTEERFRKSRRNARIQEIILRTISTAGILSVALLAPNALQALKKLGFIEGRRIESIKSAQRRLVKAGLLAYDHGHLKLTSNGETRLRQLELHNYQLKKPRRWDGKWRVLIFDIKEERRLLRSKIRATLIAIGFTRLQDSVWVYPYDCEDLIVLLKSDFKVGHELLYLIVDSIENDNWIREKFILPTN